jgi:hypothetical protein
MTSATTERVKDTDRPRGEGNGLIVFASVLLVILGCLNLIYGIAAIANSHVFTANAHYVFWSLMIIAVDVVALYGAVRLRQPCEPCGLASAVRSPCRG